MLKKKLNSTLNQQLINIDILQKYNLKDLNMIPIVQRVVFSIDLNNVDTSNFKNVSEEFLYQYSTFILYSFTCLLPHICLTKKNLVAINKKNYILKIILTNKREMEAFLQNMFLDLLEKEEIIKNIKFVLNESSISIYMPLKINLDLGNLDNKSQLLINLSVCFNNNTMKENFFFKEYPYFLMF